MSAPADQDAPSSQTDPKADALAESDQRVTAEPAAQPVVQEPAAPPAGQSVEHTPADFLERWGPDGAVWHAQGWTWLECHDLHAAKVARENERLRQRVSALEALGCEDDPDDATPFEDDRPDAQENSWPF